jgi:hypothetical protein
MRREEVVERQRPAGEERRELVERGEDDRHRAEGQDDGRELEERHASTVRPRGVNGALRTPARP